MYTLKSISAGYCSSDKSSAVLCDLRATQEEATHHQMLRMGEAVVPMDLHLQPHTEVQQVHKEVPMVVMEPQVKEDHMDPDQEVPPVGLMGLMEVNLMQDPMDNKVQQVTGG